MSDPSDASQQDVDDLRESAEEIGVDDVEKKDPYEIVEKVQKTGSDSNSSPTNPDWEDDDSYKGRGKGD